MSALTASKHIQTESGANPDLLSARLNRFNQIAREIERMAPSVDRTAHPENAEYPWESGGKVETPCHFEFPNLSVLFNPSDPVATTFLKVVRLAIRDFDKISI